MPTAAFPLAVGMTGLFDVDDSSVQRIRDLGNNRARFVKRCCAVGKGRAHLQVD